MTDLVATLLLTSAAFTGPMDGPISTGPLPVVGADQPVRAQYLLIWRPSEIACDNGESLPASTLHPVRRDRSPRRRIYGNQPQSVSYTFTLGSEQRALSVRSNLDTTRPPGQMDDLGPTIAASVFPAMPQETQCSVTFTRSQTLMTQADLADISFYRSFTRRPRISAKVWDKDFPGNCRDKPRRRPLTLNYPDFREIAKTPGAPGWVVYNYSTDDDGRPNEITILDSTGNAQLNEAGEEALAASRWTGGARSGCVQFFWTASDVVEAPLAPEEEQFGTKPEGCETPDRWENEPRLRYPENFRRRAIEGWAILRYDVAPWGEIGSVEVLDAQPSSEFGEAAQRVVRSAKFKPLDTGLKGCIERVQFRLPEPPTSVESDDDQGVISQ